jgi:competence protein ComEA
MKKRWIVVGLTVTLLIISGICYSCAFQKQDTAVLNTLELKENGKVTETTSSENIKDEDILPFIDSEAGDIKASLIEEKVSIYAHVCGAVVNPGVYEAEQGARVVDFIQLAGGLTKEAAADYINQAKSVEDGQRIYVMKESELENLTLEQRIEGEEVTRNNTKETSSVLININTASLEELMSLSGIGQAKANSIVAYREKNGKFQTIENLMDIPGIKEGLFQQISHMIVAN